MTADLSQYIRPAVRTLAKTKGTLFSEPYRCSLDGCGATVRFVGENKTSGAWRCPVCGIVLPYIFWDLRVDHAFRYRDAFPGNLIIRLATNACRVCGEGNPPCRCLRMAQAAEEQPQP